MDKQPNFRPGICFRITSRTAVTNLLDVLRSPVVRKSVAFIKKRFLQASVSVRHEVFSCNALQGSSDYNISVNSDMTVSCNCQEDGGEGILGDLSKEEFKNIFYGPVAASFRQSLSHGVLPIDTCTRCSELRRVSRPAAAEAIKHITTPIGIMMENTVACNLTCLSCTQKKLETSRSQRRMTLEDVRKVSLVVRDNSIKKVFFFKFGEPFLSPAIYEELEILRSRNPLLTIVISTNGTVIDTARKRDAALFADHIFFSIDGVTDSMVSHYQCGSSFAKAYENMKELIRLRNARGLKKPVVDWKYVLFNWNDKPQAIDEAVRLAKESGVDVLSFWQTNTPYYGKSLRRYYRKISRRCWKGWEIRFSDAGDIR